MPNPIRLGAIATFAALAAAASSSPSFAVPVTLDEAALDAVYSQPSFGATPIDVRIAAPRVLRAPDLARVDSAADQAAIFSLTAGLAPAIGVVFVDRVDWCSGFDPENAGCALSGAPGIFVEADFAAGPFGTELIAHELGHNLGLFHRTGGLMDVMLNGATDLTPEEAGTVLSSALVGTDESGRFVEIAPVTIAAIPLPATLPALAAGIFALGLIRRKV